MVNSFVKFVSVLVLSKSEQTNERWCLANFNREQTVEVSFAFKESEVCLPSLTFDGNNVLTFDGNNVLKIDENKQTFGIDSYANY